jgi:hypothetical protein
LRAFWRRGGGSLVCGLLLTMWCASVRAQDTVIGHVKYAEGWGTVTHGNLTYPAKLGFPIYEGDMLRTLWNGSIGVTFKDDTRISLGPSSRATIPKFVFAPARQHYGFVLRLIAGTMEYLSGLTAKLSPDSMQIETPTATIGVRGTRFVVRAEP